MLFGEESRESEQNVEKKKNKTLLSVITLCCPRLNFFPGSVRNYRVNFDYAVNGVQN